MNARSHVFEFTVEGRQVEEVLQCIFHSLLFHRSMGKIHFQQGCRNYTIGSIGIVDVDCDYIDCTYVRLGSDELDAAVKREVSLFQCSISPNELETSGAISLEFYQKRKARWPFPSECTPWEVWTTRLNIINLTNELERQEFHKSVGEAARAKILQISQAMDRHDYVPKMTSPYDLDLIFDTSYPDVQPYLHRITHDMSLSASSVGTTVRRFFKDTLQL